jgi:hypothetical protein
VQCVCVSVRAWVSSDVRRQDCVRVGKIEGTRRSPEVCQRGGEMGGERRTRNRAVSIDRYVFRVIDFVVFSSRADCVLETCKHLRRSCARYRSREL